MPHLILTLSNSLKSEDWDVFFDETHRLLSDYTDINSCKSRIAEFSFMSLGINQKDRVLIHLELAILPRPPELVQEIGQRAYEILEKFTAPLLKKHQLVGKPTLEVRLLQNYWH